MIDSKEPLPHCFHSSLPKQTEIFFWLESLQALTSGNIRFFIVSARGQQGKQGPVIDWAPNLFIGYLVLSLDPSQPCFSSH